MNHRERVLTALRHEEPDRVPIDFGGTDVTSIMAVPYLGLREHLGLGRGNLRIADVYQMLPMVEEDLQQALGSDVRFVSQEPQAWRKDVFAEDIRVEYPAKFHPKVLDDGSKVILDASGNVLLKMPENGHWFDPVYFPLGEAETSSDIDKHLDAIENYETPGYLDKSYEELAKKAKDLHDNTDYLLVGFFGGHIFQAAQYLRGLEPFMVDLLMNQALAQALLERLTEANMRRFERFAETIGPYVQVMEFQDDLGMQDRPLISPELYRKMIKPHHKELYGFAKSKCDAYLLLHTDGAVAPLIPDLIEAGVDALNPVQVSAAGMDSKLLKREFGQEISFWGGGCESQTILPRGTVQEVVDDVKRRIDDLAPGGGFVFGSIHNLLTGVPLENIVAMFATAREYGSYG